MEDVLQMKFSADTVSTIVIGNVGDALEHYLPKGRVIAVADASVHRLHRPLVERFEHIIIGQGESAKTLRTAEIVWRTLTEMQADRDTFLLGIGGGIVTDITGFAAATYMRGIDFGFVPTTLLAQVDASLGGKNGVNLDGYKNLVGTFAQPRFVACDTELLKTLPDREFRAGLAEMIKAAIIGDAKLFEIFERYTFDDFRQLDGVVREALELSIKVKAAIVRDDQLEQGARRVLNLGHTIGHAIEKCSRKYIHGEAVAIGTVMIVDYAAREGKLSAEDAARIRAVFEKYGFPLTADIDVEPLTAAVLHDKKRSEEFINLVLPTSIGHCVVDRVPIEGLEV